MHKAKFMFNCGICGTEFQFGPDVYNGQHISSYQLTVCKVCWDGNWDGWGPASEKILIAHLNGMDIPIPTRNEKGWLPRK